MSLGGEVVARSRARAPVKVPVKVLLWAPKGGVGKTTICYSLAVAAARSGLKVAAVDLDRQRALLAWAHYREVQSARIVQQGFEPLPVVSVAYYRVKDWPLALQQASAGGAEFIIIDTPPSPSEDEEDELKRLARECDFVLVATEPYGQSLTFTEGMGKRLQEMQKPFLFVLNKTDERRVVLRDAMARLKKSGPVSNFRIPRRDKIAETFETGEAPSDYPSNPGYDQIMSVWFEVAAKIGVKVP